MNRRSLKLNKNIQKILMEYFIRKMKHSISGFICVKEVSISTDGKSAKVYLSIISSTDQSQKVYSILEQERFFIQRSLSRSLRVKFCPRLIFFINHVSYPMQDISKSSLSDNTFKSCSSVKRSHFLDHSDNKGLTSEDL